MRLSWQFLSLISKLRVLSGSSLSVSRRSREPSPTLPLPSPFSTSIAVRRVVSLSEAVSVRWLPSSSKRIDSKIVRLLLAGATRVSACKDASSVLLETENFIYAQL